MVRFYVKVSSVSARCYTGLLHVCRLRRRLQVAYECLQKAIKAVRPGTRYRELGTIISAHAEKHGFSVVRTYCGHGIGEYFHCAPNVPHFAGNKAKGVMQVLATGTGHGCCIQ